MNITKVSNCLKLLKEKIDVLIEHESIKDDIVLASDMGWMNLIIAGMKQEIDKEATLKSKQQKNLKRKGDSLALYEQTEKKDKPSKGQNQNSSTTITEDFEIKPEMADIEFRSSPIDLSLPDNQQLVQMVNNQTNAEKLHESKCSQTLTAPAKPHRRIASRANSIMREQLTTKATEFPCYLCGIRFNHKRTLISHYNSKHGGFYKCDVSHCSARFGTQKNREIHINYPHE